MGWGSGFNSDHRKVGYAIEAECDREGCTARIDRGMGYCCGDMHNGMRDDDAPGCGDYFCGKHDVDHDCPNPDGHADDNAAENEALRAEVASLRAFQSEPRAAFNRDGA